MLGILPLLALLSLLSLCSPLSLLAQLSLLPALIHGSHYSLCSHSLLALTARTHYSYSLLAPLLFTARTALAALTSRLLPPTGYSFLVVRRHRESCSTKQSSAPTIAGFAIIAIHTTAARIRPPALGFTWLTAPQSTAKHGDAMTGLSSSGLSGQPCKHCLAQPPRSIRKLDNNAHGKQRSVGWMDR